MNDLLINPSTKVAVLKLVKGNAHAALFIGPDGRGKYTLAKEAARQKLGKKSLDVLANDPYFLNVQAENNVIGIETVRELQQFLRLRTTGDGTIRRAIVIDGAHLMTTEAQNALLKSLEEPPEDTFIAMTAAPTLNLKPTIYSRVQQVQVLAVGPSEARIYLKARGYNDKDIDKAYAISSGNVGLLVALLSEGEKHRLLIDIDTAKKILGLSTFERLVMIDTLAKDKGQLPSLLYGLKLICSAALGKAADNSDTRGLKKWINCLKAVHKSETLLPRNPNTKLLLSDLMVNL